MTMTVKKIVFLFSASLVFVFLALVNAGSQDHSLAAERDVRIGVLAKRGPEQCLEQWGETAAYLNRELPAYSFRIVPIDFPDIDGAVRKRDVDFLIVNPGIYVEMEAHHGISRIATMVNRNGDRGLTLFGGVIFCRKERDDIVDLSSFVDKSFMAVEETSLGGWVMAWREFEERGLHPYQDFSSLQFGGTHDAVVYAVRDGKVDGGTVRTDTLERMAAEGKINLRDYKVLPPPDRPSSAVGDPFHDFPYLRSTRLYPEWPIAKLPHTPEKLAKEVVSKLFDLGPESPASVTSNILGWTIAFDYQEVHNTFKLLHLGPYKDLGKIRLGDVFRAYWHWILGGCSLLVFAVLASIYFRNLSNRLKQSESQLSLAYAELDHIFNHSGDGIRIIDCDFNVLRVNRKLERMMGIDTQEACGMKCYASFSGPLCHTPGCTLTRTRSSGEQFSEEIFKQNMAGQSFDCIVSAIPLRDSAGAFIGVVEQFVDITLQKRNESMLKEALDKEKQLSAELEEAFHELKETQAKILQQEKMASIGQLAAGVAHEINNPIGYIMSNMSSLKKYQDRLVEYIGYVEGVLASDNPADSREEILARRKQLKVQVILDDCKDLIAETLEGAERVKAIVTNLKGFARIDHKAYAAANINGCIESTLNIVWNELKYKCTVDKQYGELPLTYCYPQQLNQVFMNLFVNAAHSIEKQGTITIRTWVDGDFIYMKFTDTGCGIPPENLSRIFEPFFTTKDVGKGTGLGLSISYDIIHNHHGNITVNSVVGVGTTFTIQLPVVSTPQESKMA